MRIFPAADLQRNPSEIQKAALEAPVFTSRQIFANFPTRHPLFCGMYPVAKDFEKVTGLKPDLIFLVGCQGVHGAVTEPTVMQIGPNPLLMGRHYPLDVAAPGGAPFRGRQQRCRPAKHDPRQYGGHDGPRADPPHQLQPQQRHVASGTERVHQRDRRAAQ